ncbi:hypothetical protein E4T47_07186 [Aureobasidium subglaciale]|nr:hypothetical protein E4T43_06931 [Aureobasidium subglaciale]KAI5269358.1 hypothetical protein E4T47_07186 [Aureobasidium subglaciale]
MSLVRPFSRIAARTTSSCPTCVRTFTSSTSRAEEPKPAEEPRSSTRPPIFAGILDTLKATARNNPSEGSRGLQNSRSQDLGVRRSNYLSRQSNTIKSNSSPEAVAQSQETQEFQRQMTRKWKEGDVYAPHDLSGVEMSKWSKGQQKGRPKKDVFDMLKINPMNHYWNFSMMSEYMTEMGKIKHSKDTGLRPVNQRKVAKAVRRAIGLGLMPSVHRHPEILQPRGSLGR